MATAQAYYTTQSDHGNYQFTPLSEIIDGLMLEASANSDSYIKNKPRPLFIKHAKAGIKELTFDMANDVLALELEIGDNLQFIFPQDYVDWVRLSLVGPDGKLYPLDVNRQANRAGTYLQDNEFEILFSNAGDVLEADGYNVHNKPMKREVLSSCSSSPQFQTDTSKFSKHGEFSVDKRRGVFTFSSDLARKPIMLEYISDGLQWNDIHEKEITVHKYFEDPLLRYIDWMLTNNDKNAPERQKMRLERMYRGSKQKAYSRFANINLQEVSKAFRSSLKWLKT